MSTSLGRIFNTPVHKAGFSTSAQASARLNKGETIRLILGCSTGGGFDTGPLPGDARENFVCQLLKIAPAVMC